MGSFAYSPPLPAHLTWTVASAGFVPISQRRDREGFTPSSLHPETSVVQRHSMGAREALSSSNLSILGTGNGHPERQSSCDRLIMVISLIMDGMGLAQLSGEELFAKDLKFQAVPHKC